MKTDRQRLIMKIILSAEVHNQDELQKMLEEQGLSVTQATLSRDVNELGLIKHRAKDGNLCYCKKQVGPEVAPNTAAEGIKGIEISGGFAVIKTHPGFASVVATTIDHAVIHCIMGTIAGDDTILIIIRPKSDTEELLASLDSILPGISTKITK